MIFQSLRLDLNRVLAVCLAPFIIYTSVLYLSQIAEIHYIYPDEKERQFKELTIFLQPVRKLTVEHRSKLLNGECPFASSFSPYLISSEWVGGGDFIVDGIIEHGSDIPEVDIPGVA